MLEIVKREYDMSIKVVGVDKMSANEKEKKRIQVNIDKDLAEEAESVFNELGLNQTSALTAFYKKVVAEGGIPFELKLTEEQKANHRLQNAASQLPATELNSRKEVDDWFKDESYDY